MSKEILFRPVQLGNHSLSNRIIMAPLTRCRASLGHVANDLMAEYYSQRASAGLIIAEATMIEEGNSAFISEPGIANEEQVAGWRKVTSAVHKKGGKIFLQIWHGGRACHPYLNQGHSTVSSSAIAIDGETHTPQGKVPHVVPREIPLREIPRYVELYKRAATNAKLANFDGIEVHGANGYLIDQFLRDSVNKRNDGYGGSIPNRARFLFEILESVIPVWGSGSVGLRLSPLNSYNSMKDSQPVELVKYLSKELNRLDLSYLHMMRGDFFGVQKAPVMETAREFYNGNIIGNMGYTPEEAAEAIGRNRIQAVAIGNLFISNPDLVERIRLGKEFTPPEVATYYTPGPKGYTDYRAL